MIDRSYDVLVLGDGMAGVAAALAAREKGATACVVSLGPGATALSSGAWDFGPIPGDVSLEEAWESPFFRSALGGALCPPELLAVRTAREAVEAMRESLASECDIAASYDRPFLLPVSDGRWRRAYVAQSLQALGDRSALSEKRVGVPFCPEWRWAGPDVARALGEAARRAGAKTELVPLPVAGAWHGPDAPLSHVGVRLAADVPAADRLFQAIARAAREAGVEALLFPPVFASASLARRATDATGMAVAECLAAGEPVAGLRLERALHAACDAKGISRFRALEVDLGTAGGSVAAAHARLDPASVEVLRAKIFVLATGKLIGGGIALGYEEVRETVLGLPVFVERGMGPIRRRAEIPWPDRGWGEAQPWAKLGLKVDALWRPIGSDDRPIFDNVMACGTILGGIDLARHSVGLGFCALTGRGCGLAVS